jgi:hypothetical protein
MWGFTPPVRDTLLLVSAQAIGCDLAVQLVPHAGDVHGALPVGFRRLAGGMPRVVARNSSQPGSGAEAQGGNMFGALLVMPAEAVTVREGEQLSACGVVDTVAVQVLSQSQHAVLCNANEACRWAVLLMCWTPILTFPMFPQRSCLSELCLYCMFATPWLCIRYAKHRGGLSALSQALLPGR